MTMLTLSSCFAIYSASARGAHSVSNVLYCTLCVRAQFVRQNEVSIGKHAASVGICTSNARAWLFWVVSDLASKKFNRQTNDELFQELACVYIIILLIFVVVVVVQEPNNARCFLFCDYYVLFFFVYVHLECGILCSWIGRNSLHWLCFFFSLRFELNWMMLSNHGDI